MRYFTGFIGGFVVAVLLLVFQNHLVSGERNIQPPPNHVIALATVTNSRPAEIKPYEPKEPPPEPERVKKPLPATDPSEPRTVRPELTLTPRITGVPGTGDGPYISWTDGPMRGDGPAVLKSAVAPQYPGIALREGIEGEVEVEFTVLADGSVIDVRIVRATPAGMFEQSARRAVLGWQFMPRMENGTAMTTRVRQVIEFRLPKE